MIILTGDTHGDFARISDFPLNMTQIVMIFW